MNGKWMLCMMMAAAAFPAHATTPCMPSPCFRVEEQRYDVEQCLAVADWVAEGAVENVAHNFQGEMLQKDFASFDFVPQHWIKGKSAEEKWRFTVGWCKNMQELPADTSGTFRFYGKNAPTSNGGPSYLYFEKAQ